MWSCFEDLDAINMMLQSEFNLDIPSETYGFFLFQTCLQVDDVIVFSYLHASTYIFISRMQTVRFIGLKCSPPRIEQLLQVMVRYSIALSDM